MTTKTVISKYYFHFKIFINKLSSKIFLFNHFDHPLLELSVTNFIFKHPVGILIKNGSMSCAHLLYRFDTH